MTSEQPDSGIYLLILDLPSGFSAAVGGLGRLVIDPGRYAYVGSARRGLFSRLSRHRRRRKPLRWHIDRLTRVADVVAAIVWPWEPGRECALARALQETRLGQLVGPRFGASDCRCAGHLLALPEVNLDSIAEHVSRLLGAEAAQIRNLVREQRGLRRQIDRPQMPAAV